MARTMSKVIPVGVITDQIHCYATIQRSMMTAITACMRLNDDQCVDELNKIRQWASMRFDECVDEKSMMS